MASFLKKLGYLSNEKVFLKFHCLFFPLYHHLLFGSFHREPVLLSLSHINYIIMKLLFFILGYIIIIIIIIN